MKKILILVLTLILTAGIFAGCSNDSAGQTKVPAATVTAEPEEDAEPAVAETAETAEQEPVPYAFELTDIDGNVHKLSDYQGKPVYLKVWGSWCPPCVESLPHLNELAAEAEDFAVLSVVPQISGEKDREEFTEWFKQQGYDNITVLYDEDASIVSDFGITGFPTQIFFDANGVAVYGAVGVLEKDVIVDTMDKIISGEVD